MTVLDLVARHEGFKPQVYCDRCGKGLQRMLGDPQLRRCSPECTGGNLTVGIGTRVDGPGITEPEARLLASQRLQAIAGELDLDPIFEGLGEVRQAALCDMAYTMGVTGVLKFAHMFACLEKMDFQGAADAVLHSLWAREAPTRAAEIAFMLRTGEWPTSK